MKRTLFFLLIAVCVFNLHGQSTVNYPSVDKQTQKDVYIESIISNEDYTQLNFEFLNSKPQNYYILLHPPLHKNAFYIMANGRKYKLISVDGIANTDEVTLAETGKIIFFSARFEKLPLNTEKFDLIEGENGAWNFFGVSNKQKEADRSINSNSINISELEYCDSIIFIPESPKPSFSDMLAGVKDAVILYSERLRIGGYTPMFEGLKKHLKNMGFENIHMLKIKNDEDMEDLSDYPNAVAMLAYCNFSVSPFTQTTDYSNLEWTFFSIQNHKYTWKFESKNLFKISLYKPEEVGSNYFQNAFRSMYQYIKPKFDPSKILKLEKMKTCWSEEIIKNYIQEKGCDKLEGIYEGIVNSDEAYKYKVALKKINGDYYLIYLSGAESNINWETGEVKAKLEPTASPLTFKTNWILSDKSVNSDYYISFESGCMNLYDEQQQKNTYLKLFPSSNDNYKNSSPESACSGTGWALTSNGYIVTNNHITDGAKTLKVRGINGDFSKAYNAKITVTDAKNDLSIIKIEDANFTSLGTIPYVISSKTSDVGSSIFVLGYPLRASMGDEVKLTNGIISSKSGFQGDVTTYQISAPVQPGNSGGPLFDKNGNIIGIINAKNIDAENASYAIKTTYLQNLIDLMPVKLKLQTINLLTTKPLIEQVKIAKKFAYIIEATQ